MYYPFKTQKLYRKDDAPDTDDLKENKYDMEYYELYPFLFDLHFVVCIEPSVIDLKKVTVVFFSCGQYSPIMEPYEKMEQLFLKAKNEFAKNN